MGENLDPSIFIFCAIGNWLTYKVLPKTRESAREVLATPPESARTKCSCLAIFDRFSAVSWPFLGRFLNFWPFFLQRSFFLNFFCNGNFLTVFCNGHFFFFFFNFKFFDF